MSTSVSSARTEVEIDIFTLFPEAFAWFERQRHVANALARDTRALSPWTIRKNPFGRNGRVCAGWTT